MLDDTLHTCLFAVLFPLGACGLDVAPTGTDAIQANADRSLRAALPTLAAPTVVAAASNLQRAGDDDDTPITTMETVGASPRD